MHEPILSVVAPCYNEEAVLLEFHRRMSAACQELALPYELVLVNDGSRDATWELMQHLTRDDPNVVAVNLARNHGHQLALTAGLSVCRGEHILIIDADLQDPPELLPTMLKIAEEGADVVYGQRRKRQGESWFKRVSAALFYRCIGQLSSVPIPPDTGDFRLISRRVLEALLAMPERHRFIRGMVSWIGFHQEAILYDRDPRFAGETKYPLRKMWRLAVDAVTSFSTQPLHFAGYLGVALLLASTALLGGSLVQGLTGAAVDQLLVQLGAMGFLGGVQLMGLGVLGTYLGRLCEQSKGRPLFLIERVERHQARSAGPERGERTPHKQLVSDRPR